MSANSTVACLRSPWAKTAGVAACALAGTSGRSLVPQWPQNRAFAACGWPQLRQEPATDAPQPAQNALSSEIAALHTRQRMSARKPPVDATHLSIARRQGPHGGSDCLNDV